MPSPLTKHLCYCKAWRNPINSHCLFNPLFGEQRQMPIVLPCLFRPRIGSLETVCVKRLIHKKTFLKGAQRSVIPPTSSLLQALTNMRKHGKQRLSTLSLRCKCAFFFQKQYLITPLTYCLYFPRITSTWTRQHVSW